MGHYIFKLEHEGQDYFMEWSSIVDAPVTYGMLLDEFKDYYHREYGRAGTRDLNQRLARVEASGTSSHHHRNVDELIFHNRAGCDETRLNREQLIDVYIIHRDEADYRVTGQDQEMICCYCGNDITEGNRRYRPNDADNPWCLECAKTW